MTKALPESYELSFLIGEVVRNDVSAETEMRMVWWTLEKAQPTHEKIERDLGRLIKQVRRALNHPTLPEPLRNIALDVVERTSMAHRRRNLLVHDQWIALPWDRQQIRSMRSATSTQLSELRACAAELLELTWRLRGVAIITPTWIGPHQDPYETTEDIRSWTRIAMGHIAEQPGPISGTPGPAPIAPGLEQLGIRRGPGSA